MLFSKLLFMFINYKISLIIFLVKENSSCKFYLKKNVFFYQYVLKTIIELWE